MRVSISRTSLIGKLKVIMKTSEVILIQDEKETISKKKTKNQPYLQRNQLTNFWPCVTQKTDLKSNCLRLKQLKRLKRERN